MNVSRVNTATTMSNLEVNSTEHIISENGNVPGSSRANFERAQARPNGLARVQRIDYMEYNVSMTMIKCKKGFTTITAQ